MNYDAFYSTAATVIPVLVLALFVERRVLRSGKDQDPRSTIALNLLVLVALGWGEMTALNGLLVNDKSSSSRTLVFMATFIGFAALFQPYFVQLANSLGRQAAAGLGAMVVVTPAGVMMASGDDAAVLPSVGIGTVIALGVLYVVYRGQEERLVRETMSRTDAEAADTPGSRSTGRPDPVADDAARVDGGAPHAPSRRNRDGV